MAGRLMYAALPKRLQEACIDAIELAKESENYLETDGRLHPLVGAVFLDQKGNVLAQGSRRQDGQSHAEVVAVNSLTDNAKRHVHTVVTTLEPCCYRRDSTQICCAKRIVRLDPQQVIIGMLDPAASVRGRGAQILQLRRIYFTTFPKDLQEEVNRVNERYIKFESELYTSGKPPRRKKGIVQDDEEFSIDHAPPRVIDCIKDPSFTEMMKPIYEDLQSRRLTSSSELFAHYFAMEATAPHSGIASMLEAIPEHAEPSLFELIACYKAIPAPKNEEERKVERDFVYQCIGEWWFKHRRKLLLQV